MHNGKFPGEGRFLQEPARLVHLVDCKPNQHPHLLPAYRSVGSQCHPLQPSAHLGSNSEATAAKTKAAHKADRQPGTGCISISHFLTNSFVGCFFTARNLTKFCPKILSQAEGKQPGTGLQGWDRSAPCLFRTRSKSDPATGDACPKSSSKSHMGKGSGGGNRNLTTADCSTIR